MASEQEKVEKQWLAAQFFSLTQGQGQPNRSQPKAISMAHRQILTNFYDKKT